MEQLENGNSQPGLSNPGVRAALAAAILFGAGTPLAKCLIGDLGPWLLAGLLYLGAGTGLLAYRFLSRRPWIKVSRHDWLWFSGAIFFGGVAGPVLLMSGLASLPASDASLLLNAEGVFTALLAWFAFRENFDARIACGMALISGGAVILSLPEKLQLSSVLPSLLILGACLSWAIDNNLTRKVSLSDPAWIAAVKGIVAGFINILLATVSGAGIPQLKTTVLALLIGWLSYGVSLSLFVRSLRHIGTARTGAYFSVAPFFGALVALLFLGEPVTWRLLLAGLLMAAGVWLHLTERHVHEHTHEELSHEHEHIHDEHHRHAHDESTYHTEKASHRHTHTRITHSHPHYPDAHHRHRH